MVIECEFAFRLAHDLPARAEPYTREEVAAAVGSVHAAIEVVAGHIDDWINQDVWSVIADNGTDGAVIVGDGTSTGATSTCATVDVTLQRNGELVREGTGADILGDPMTAFAWLANARRAAGDGLTGGMTCNTGTATSICPAEPGDELVAVVRAARHHHAHGRAARLAEPDATAKAPQQADAALLDQHLPVDLHREHQRRRAPPARRPPAAAARRSRAARAPATPPPCPAVHTAQPNTTVRPTA